jgi:hypothetical protein
VVTYRGSPVVLKWKDVVEVPEFRNKVLGGQRFRWPRVTACFRRAIQTGSDPDPACVDAAHATLGTTFAKIDAKGGCSATGDAPSIALLVDRFSEQLAQELNGTCLLAGSPCGNITLCCAGLACTVTTLGQTPVCG